MVKPQFYSHLRKTFSLSLPLIGGQLAQIAIGTTDVLMLGWSGTLNLASGVLGAQAIFILFLFGAGFAHAVVPLAAQALGEENIRSVRRIVRMGFWVVTLFSIVALAILWFIEPIFLGLGQDVDVSRLASEYVYIAMWTICPLLWTLVLRNFFTILERANIVFWAVIPGVLVNCLLNYMLIFGNWGAPEMGVEGAAWASVVSSTLIFIIMLFWYLSHTDFLKFELFVRFWRMDPTEFIKICTIGLPISITIFAEVSMFIGASILMGWIGVDELAAHGIALQLTAITFMVPLGLSNAATVRIGNALGRKNVYDIKMAANSAVVLSAGLAAIGALMFLLFPEFLVGLFLDESQASAKNVANIAVTLVLIAASYQIFDALQITGAGLLRGIQDINVPMLISVVCYGPMGLATGWFLGIHLGIGPMGVWIGLQIGLFTACVLLLIRFYSLQRQLELNGI